MGKHAIKKLSFEMRYLTDQFQTQQILDKAILESLFQSGILNSVLDFHKNQQICDKAVDNYLCVLEFVAKCYKSQKIWDKAVNTPHSSTIKYIPDTSRLGMLSAFFCFFYQFFWAGKQFHCFRRFQFQLKFIFYFKSQSFINSIDVNMKRKNCF